MTQSSNSDHGAQNAQHVSGAHLAALLGVNPGEGVRLAEVVGDARARIVVEWLRTTLYHGRDPIDPVTGKPDVDPYLDEIPVIPVDIVAEALGERGARVPTRREVRDFADRDGSPDPEDELLYAKYVADPDLDAAADSAERRICGVPESIYEALDAHAQAKVRAGLVISPPQAPTYVARWLVRNVFTARLPLPAATGGRRRRVWMRTLVRVDRTWYSYERTAAGGPRWVAKADPEWMRGRLREELARLWFLKDRRENGQVIYDHLKAWNPDDRSLTQVENASADLVNISTGTHARELPDARGRMHTAYTAQSPVLCRTGVLDVATGTLTASTPLWFSLTRVEAEYDHKADYNDSEWLRTLRAQWFDDPRSITCLQQWFGYVISNRNDLQRLM